MKVLVLSDSHKDFPAILRAMEREKGTDYIIHAGDVHRDVEDIEAMWRQIPCISVLGNNDFGIWDVPTRRDFTLGNKKFLLTHGHLYGVKGSLSRLWQEAAKADADICIFGHTHVAHLDEKNGIRMLNPGAAHRSYAVIEIDGDSIAIEIKEN